MVRQDGKAEGSGMKKMDMPRDEARRIFNYVDGHLVWNCRDRSDFLKDADWKAWNSKYPGTVAGASLRSGYIVIAVTQQGVKKKYLLHRLIWSWHNGPTDIEIDHRDNDVLNNRIENLREATGSQNKANRRKCRKFSSEFVGVSFEAGRRRWKAGIRLSGRNTVTLGRFKCPTAAAIAYDRAAIKEFGEFAKLNFLKHKVSA